MHHNSTPIRLTLNRDLSKHLKRGNPWVFADVIATKPDAPAGSVAHLYTHRNEFLGSGFYCPQTNLTFRMVILAEKKILYNNLKARMEKALSLKRHLHRSEQNSFRLFNGEGDELPGLVCDVYADLAVIKLDGKASEGFWDVKLIAQWLVETKLVKGVYLKRRNREDDKGEVLIDGGHDLSHHQFLENSARFETHIIDAAKTGFFLDQRDNRKLIESLSNNKTLLNLFGYTGGFSIFAGLGGASMVTTVDIAPKAIEAASVNWKLNHLPSEKHIGIVADAFLWIKEAISQRKTWDIVITDPPSFAPNEKSIETAKAAYIEVFSDSIKLTTSGGLFAASSCSGHISFEDFLELVRESLSKARRKGQVVVARGQPEDHTWPMALEEMRYLKFVLVRVD
jgi:23S rRNA (cytosine1962-C5)-methyltransferase